MNVQGTDAYRPMRIGEVKPGGWLLCQMELDLQEGIAGAYDRISDNVAQNLFAAQNRAPGVWMTSSRGIREKAWWSGEHEGYWMSGLVRLAVMTGNQRDLDRVKRWVEQILLRFETTGYVGIYSPESRFPSEGFDGELWTQSRAFDAMLAWYEYTGDDRVLRAVEQTVRLTIDHYRNTGTYFARPGSDGGVRHGVGYMDTLEWLWRLTGNAYYAKAACWLYKDFCEDGNGESADLHLQNLLDEKKLWRNHAPHTVEGMAMPAIAGFFSGDSACRQAAENVYTKLARHTNPGGGVVAGAIENIDEVHGSGDAGNEYCSKTEAAYSLNRMFIYDGNLLSGDWVERCVLNAAQGARFHPVNTAVIYISRDNRLCGVKQGREEFSAAHRAAACCTLNSIRLLPAYVEGMWFRSTQELGFLANLYGAGELNTEIGGERIKIIQETDYPFSSQVLFRVETEHPVAFSLTLRIPSGSGDVKVDAGDEAQVLSDARLIRISKVWESGDTVNVDFDFQVTRRAQHDGKQAYYSWGPLVFALKIPEVIAGKTEIKNKTVPTGFYDYHLLPASQREWSFIIHPDAEFKKVELPGRNKVTPWANPPVGLAGTVLNEQDGIESVVLLPLGSTLLRRTTFALSRKVVVTRDIVSEFAGAVDDETDPMRSF